MHNDLKNRFQTLAGSSSIRCITGNGQEWWEGQAQGAEQPGYKALLRTRVVASAGPLPTNCVITIKTLYKDLNWERVLNYRIQLSPREATTKHCCLDTGRIFCLKWSSNPSLKAHTT